MEVIFKPMQTEEIPETIALCNEIFEETTSAEKAKIIFDATKDDPNQIYLNGVADGKVIAHTKISIIPTIYEDMKTYAIINHFCVRDDYRRQGIASLMLSEVTKICQAKNCQGIKLWSKNFRFPAHSCYQAFGFTKLDASFFELEI